MSGQLTTSIAGHYASAVTMNDEEEKIWEYLKPVLES
jgi:hypothetical protein